MGKFNKIIELDYENRCVVTQPCVTNLAITQAVQEVNTQETTESVNLENDNQVVVKSPIIGTFYRKPSPDKPSFVEVGQSISKGDVLCVIEAMKLFNEIESDFSGKIVKILVDDQSPVEFDQPLFIIDPS